MHTLLSTNALAEEGTAPNRTRAHAFERAGYALAVGVWPELSAMEQVRVASLVNAGARPAVAVCWQPLSGLVEVHYGLAEGLHLFTCRGTVTGGKPRH